MKAEPKTNSPLSLLIHPSFSAPLARLWRQAVRPAQGCHRACFVFENLRGMAKGEQDARRGSVFDL